jgi:photosystem II stability/assembly factor-like uncharacterized protein
MGVGKSTNGGTSWSCSATGLPPSVVTVLALDPQTPTTLYAGLGGGGVFTSTDGGGRWRASGVGLPFKGRVFKLQGASQDFLSVC